MITWRCDRQVSSPNFGHQVTRHFSTRAAVISWLVIVMLVRQVALPPTTVQGHLTYRLLCQIIIGCSRASSPQGSMQDAVGGQPPPQGRTPCRSPLASLTR